MDFFSRGLDAEYKNKGIIIQVSENGSSLEVIVALNRFCRDDMKCISVLR